MLVNALHSMICDEVIDLDSFCREILGLIIGKFCCETMNMLILFMVQTYCRIWGKGFIRNLTTTNFKNLIKAVKSKMDVLADVDNRGVRKKKGENRGCCK